MATRIVDPQSLIFDHAAQFFTVSDPCFAELNQGWLKQGLVREWQGTVGKLEVGGHLVPLPSSPRRYVGVIGMRLIADSLLSQITWISKLERFNGMWYLSENGKPSGQFDSTVIAHNGKCANRLLGSSGLPLIAGQMKKLELSSVWALLAVFEDPIQIPGSEAFPFEGAFVKASESISWMAKKYHKTPRLPDWWHSLLDLSQNCSLWKAEQGSSGEHTKCDKGEGHNKHAYRS